MSKIGTAVINDMNKKMLNPITATIHFVTDGSLPDHPDPENKYGLHWSDEVFILNKDDTIEFGQYDHDDGLFWTHDQQLIVGKIDHIQGWAYVYDVIVNKKG